MIIREVRIKLYTRDQQKRRAFYEEALGWTIKKEWHRGETDWGVMYAPAANVVLELLPPEKTYGLAPAVDLSLEVGDAAAEWQRLQSTAAIIFPLRHNPWGDQSFCIADPEGFELTFFSKIP